MTFNHHEDKKMSLRLSLNRLKPEDRSYLETSLRTDDGENCYHIDDTNETIHVPFCFGRENFIIVDNDGTKDFIDLRPEMKLRTEQKVMVEKCTENLLETGSVVISARPGFGKTVTAIYMACRIIGARRTAIVVNKLILVDQWIESIERFTNVTCQYIKTSTDKISPESRFVIVNALNVQKKPSSFWKDIDLVVVDELHQIVTKILSKSLLRFVPKYLIGLSATPYRFDDYDKAIDWFFGHNVIGKPLFAKHIVKIISTGFRPKRLKYTFKGLDWNSVLNEQSENDNRNDIIVDTILSCPDRTWLILVKRVDHAKLLKDKFESKNITCETLVGNALTFDRSCRILIGTTSKIGVGFDHAVIDALCIAADVKNYFVQFLGRCMRRTEICEPLVIDFKDEFGPLDRHLEFRLSEYRKYGGEIYQD